MLRALGLGFANLALGGAQWLSLLLLATLAGRAEAGSWALATGIAAPLVALTSFAPRIILATHAGAPGPARQWFRLRVSTGALVLPAALLAALLLRARGAALVVVAGLTAARLVESLGDVLSGFWLRRSTTRPIAIATAARATALLGAVLAATLAGGRSWQAALLVLLGYAAVFALVELRLARRLGPESTAPVRAWDHATLKSGALVAVVGGLVALYAGIPRLTLAPVRGLGSVGEFAVLAALFTVGSPFVNAAAQANLSRLAKAAGTGDQRRFLSLTATMMLAAASLGLLLLLGISELPVLGVRDIGGVELARAAVTMRWLGLATILGYAETVVMYAGQAAGLFRWQAGLYAGSVLLHAALAAAFVPRAGVAGAAQALACANLVQLAAGVGLLARARSRQPVPVAAGVVPG